MREDIAAGLKNAFERGESMEKAVQAFISAGYNKSEVEEAAKSLGFPHPQEEQSAQPQPISAPIQQTQQKPQFQPLPKSPSLAKEIPVPIAPAKAPEIISNTPLMPDNSEKSGSTGKLKLFNIILGVIGFILLVVIGISAWNYFKS